MNGQSSITIHMVHGGFILMSDTTHFDGSHKIDGEKVEVFTSQGKLMKAVRAAIDEGSLVKKEKDEVEAALTA